MSLLWMSFARDIRLLWEEGATLARMVTIIIFYACACRMKILFFSFLFLGFKKK